MTNIREELSNCLFCYQNKQQKAYDNEKLWQRKDYEKVNEPMLSSFPFITGVVYLKAHSYVWDNFWQLKDDEKIFFLTLYCPISQELNVIRQWNLVS